MSRERQCHPRVLHGDARYLGAGGRGDVGSCSVPLWSRSIRWISVGPGEGPSTETEPPGVPYRMWLRHECGFGSQCLESQLCHLLAVEYWASDIISQSLSFLYCKPSDNLSQIWGGPRLIE